MTIVGPAIGRSDIRLADTQPIVEWAAPKSATQTKILGNAESTGISLNLVKPIPIAKTEQKIPNDVTSRNGAKSMYLGAGTTNIIAEAMRQSIILNSLCFTGSPHE